MTINMRRPAGDTASREKRKETTKSRKKANTQKSDAPPHYSQAVQEAEGFRLIQHQITTRGPETIPPYEDAVHQLPLSAIHAVRHHAWQEQVAALQSMKRFSRKAETIQLQGAHGLTLGVLGGAFFLGLGAIPGSLAGIGIGLAMGVLRSVALEPAARPDRIHAKALVSAGIFKTTSAAKAALQALYEAGMTDRSYRLSEMGLADDMTMASHPKLKKHFTQAQVGALRDYLDVSEAYLHSLSCIGKIALPDRPLALYTKGYVEKSWESVDYIKKLQSHGFLDREFLPHGNVPSQETLMALFASMLHVTDISARWSAVQQFLYGDRI